MMYKNCEYSRYLYDFLLNQFVLSKIVDFNNPIRNIDSPTFYSFFYNQLIENKVVYPIFIDSINRKKLTENFKKLGIEKIYKFNILLRKRIKNYIKEIKNGKLDNIYSLIDFYHLIGTLRIYGKTEKNKKLYYIYKNNVCFLYKCWEMLKGQVSAIIEYSIMQTIISLNMMIKENKIFNNLRIIENSIKSQMENCPEVKKFIYTYMIFYYHQETPQNVDVDEQHDVSKHFSLFNEVVEEIKCK